MNPIPRIHSFFVRHPRLRRVLAAAGGAALALFLFLAVLNLLIPYPVEKLVLDPSPILRDCRGEPLRRMLADGEVWRITVPLDQIQPALIEATIAAEDRRFRDHCGVDPLAVVRAVWLNLRSLRVVSGASTLTMQVVKLIEPRPRTFWGKAVEALRALQLERVLTKEEILHQYLNRAPYGGNLSGVEAAARAYFGKHASELDLAQCAMLAGLPQSPTRLRPDRYPERARSRRDYVLDRLADQGRAPEAEIARARTAPSEVRRRPFEWVARHFTLRFGAITLDQDDVRTTLDLRMQQLAEDRLARHVQRLATAGIGNGAVVVLENATGAVRALVGSVQWNEPALSLIETDDGQVDGTRARRAPGSTLKPFLYAFALDSGVISPGETLFDVPVTYRDYEPENMDRSCRGLVSLDEALVSSLNLPAVRVLQATGVTRFLTVLRELGMTTLTAPPEQYGLGLALGGCDVTLLDLTHAYMTLARGGTYVPLHWVEADAEKTLGPRPSPVLSAESVAVITRILQDRSRLGLAEAGNLPAAGARVAWKTGTSHGHHDAWCVGFDPRWTIGVWLGNPSGRPSPGLVAVEAAAPLLHDLFAALGTRTDEDWPASPAGLYERPVCALSGRPAGPNCPHTVTGVALRFRSPEKTCEVHAAPGETRWPADVEAWLRERGTPSGSGMHAANGPPRITAPHDGEKFVLLDGAPECSKLTLRATAPAGPLHWFVDAARIAEVQPGEPVAWTLTAGSHRIVCVDSSGRSDVVVIRVTR